MGKIIKGFIKKQGLKLLKEKALPILIKTIKKRRK